MTTQCFTPVRGRRMRATRLDSCGRPVYGLCSQVVSKGFVSVKFSAETEDGEEVTVKNASGELCASDVSCSQIKWWTVEIEFCQVDPSLIQMMNPTFRTELDAKGNIVGWRMNSTQSCDKGIGLEVWTDVLGADSCDDPDAEGAYGYVVVPYVVGGTFGDLEITSDALSVTVTGRTKANSKWGVGPYGVVRDIAGKPSPLLVPFDRDEPMGVQVTTVPPPEPTCGCQILNPFGSTLKVTAKQDGTDKSKYTFDISGAPAGQDTAKVDFGDGTPVEDVTLTSGAGTSKPHSYDSKVKSATATAAVGQEHAQTSVLPGV